MGFSVTAANAIFFVAGLTAASAALDVIWHSSSNATEARVTWERAASSEVDTDLTLTVDTCDSGCDPATVPIVRIDVINAGTTVVDHRNLTFVIDGRAHTVANMTGHDIVDPTSISNTDLILPGETMRVEFRDVPVSANYTTATLPVWVVTLDGVIGGR